MPSDILYPDISEASGLVMEEQEKERREEEAERWRDREDIERRGMSEAATLPVKRSWPPQQPGVFVTRAVMECARHINPSEGPMMNGVIRTSVDGTQTSSPDQTDPDEKPPKLVVNLGQSDKALQFPETSPNPEPEIEAKKVDETDGQAPQDSCLVDCLYYTLQCCECTIM